MTKALSPPRISFLPITPPLLSSPLPRLDSLLHCRIVGAAIAAPPQTLNKLTSRHTTASAALPRHAAQSGCLTIFAARSGCLVPMSMSSKSDSIPSPSSEIGKIQAGEEGGSRRLNAPELSS